MVRDVCHGCAGNPYKVLKVTGCLPIFEDQFKTFLKTF